MWLVATQIPRSVREFLDDKGIEYSEIHVSEFRRVADRRGFTIKSEAENDEFVSPRSLQLTEGRRRAPGTHTVSDAVVPTGPVVTSCSGQCPSEDSLLESTDSARTI